MTEKNTERGALTRAYQHMLEEAEVLWPKLSPLHLAPDYDNDDDMIPVCAGIATLCSIFSATADDENLGAFVQALRQHFGRSLTNGHVIALLYHAGDTDATALASAYELSLYIYPDGRVWVPVTNFATYHERGVWHVHAAGLPPETTGSLSEMVKLISAYGREGRRPAALE